jgi:hypothetical protein
MGQVVVKDSAAEVPARPLKVLIPLINDALDHAHEAGIEYRRQAGALFLEAKASFNTTAEWYSWIGRTFKHRDTGNRIAETTVKRWTQLAETTKEFKVARDQQPFRNISEFTSPHRESHHRPAWHEPVREALNTVNVERLMQEKQSKEKEQRLMRGLANELIDIGYKVLASKLHPDKGGSSEAMARLNRVRSILKNAI